MRYRAEAMAALLAASLVCFADERPDPCVRTLVDPVRVVWTCGSGASYGSGHEGDGPEILLGARHGQFPEGPMWTGSGYRLVHDGKQAPAILLDFGREMFGGIRIGVGGGTTRGVRLRIRFGESVAEAMSELGERGACNVHAMRDFTTEVTPCGRAEMGCTGFRFVRIDVLEKGRLSIDYVRAVASMRPLKRLGAFRCSDERLNRVFETAAYTANLCSQDYLWDGIKRDQCVWMGDMHPELMAILTAFGAEHVLPDSIGFMAETTPADRWMNNTMAPYTLWWMKCMHDWWYHTGDTSLATRHRDYFKAICAKVARHVSPTNDCALPREFLDWPSEHNRPAVHAGMQALMVLAFRDGAELADAIGEPGTASLCRDCVRRLETRVFDPNGSKSAAALMALAGLRDPKALYADVLGKGDTSGVTTFYGYYMLEAMSAAGENQHALDTVRDYWGAMLDMGATSFWESFDVAWTNNAFRIDELPVAGKVDIHGDYGEFCYKGFRHSLCHGWSSGPAAWLIRNVLGVRPCAPGCAAVEVKPFLGDLAWAEGAFPTPKGPVKVRVERAADGSLSTTVNAPLGIKVIR